MASVIAGDDGFSTSAGGIVLQTRYVVFEGTKVASTSALTPFELDDLSVTITPTSADSVFKLELCVSHGAASKNIVFSAMRDSTYIAPSGAGSNQNAGIVPSATNDSGDDNSSLDVGSYVYVDAPSTENAITYTPTLQTNGGDTVYINRTISDTDSSAFERCISTFIVTELSPYS